MLDYLRRGRGLYLKDGIYSMYTITKLMGKDWNDDVNNQIVNAIKTQPGKLVATSFGTFADIDLETVLEINPEFRFSDTERTLRNAEDGHRVVNTVLAETVLKNNLNLFKLG